MEGHTVISPVVITMIMTTMGFMATILIGVLMIIFRKAFAVDATISTAIEGLRESFNRDIKRVYDQIGIVKKEIVTEFKGNCRENREMCLKHVQDQLIHIDAKAELNASAILRIIEANDKHRSLTARMEAVLIQRGQLPDRRISDDDL